MPAHAKKPTATGANSSSRVNNQPRKRDLMWGRPVFKAPQLPTPHVTIDPMPFNDVPPARDTGKQA